MVLKRALAKRIGRALIGVFAFAQIAVAAYACPAPSAQRATVTSEHQAMPDCDQIDASAANLCSEHCKVGQQSSNPAPALGAMALGATVLYVLRPLDGALAEGIGARPPDPLLAAAPPPHAILHCVLRI